MSYTFSILFVFFVMNIFDQQIHVMSYAPHSLYSIVKGNKNINFILNNKFNYNFNNLTKRMMAMTLEPDKSPNKNNDDDDDDDYNIVDDETQSITTLATALAERMDQNNNNDSNNDDSDANNSNKNNNNNNKNKNNGKESQKKIVARITEHFISRFFKNRCEFVKGLNVNVQTESNRNLLKGRVDEIEVAFDQLAFGQMWITGGGTILIKKLDLRMRRFFFQNGLQSLRKPYEIYGDFLLKQQDIVNSKFIRDVLQRLADTVLQKALRLSDSVFSLEIRRVTIRERRLYIKGDADFGNGGAIVPFEISTSTGVRSEGQVVYLKEITLVLNPESALRTSVPVLTPYIDVDIGNDFRLDALVVADQHVWIRARSTISPIDNFSVSGDSDESMDGRGQLGSFKYDMGKLLAGFLRFKGAALFDPGKNNNNNNDNNSDNNSDSSSDNSRRDITKGGKGDSKSISDRYRS